MTAEDQFNNKATGYGGTVAFSSSDSGATVPTNSVLTAGQGTFGATLTTAGGQALTATDLINGSISGASGTITVSAAATTHFVVSAPGAAIAGSPIGFTVTAEDQFNNKATGYGGTVVFSSSDHGASTLLPGNTTLVAGQGTFNATLTTAGGQALTATDLISGSITGASGTIVVSPTAASHFTVAVPSPVSRGIGFGMTVTALDPFNNTATGYTGTVGFTSSDGAATLPAATTLAAGIGNFNATLGTLGSQTITASDTQTASITGHSSTIVVNRPPATHFAFSGSPASTTAGVVFQFTVIAEDQFNNTAINYGGTVLFSSSDPGAATLPASSTLLAGVGTFSATLVTAGNQTVTATDATTGSVNGTLPITITPATAQSLFVAAPQFVIAGRAFPFVVTAQDQFGNTDTNYAGTVGFAISDGALAPRCRATRL